MIFLEIRFIKHFKGEKTSLDNKPKYNFNHKIRIALTAKTMENGNFEYIFSKL
jgi:hypothetical protein